MKLWPFFNFIFLVYIYNFKMNIYQKIIKKYFVREFSVSSVQSARFRPNCMDQDEMSGLLLGIHHFPQKEGVGFKTKTSEAYDKLHGGKLDELVRKAGPIPRLGETRVFYDLDPQFNVVVVVGLGEECVGYNEREQMDEWKESIRIAAGSGVRKLQELHARTVHIESFGHAESSAEGAAMGMWVYQEHKSPEQQIFIPRLELFDDCDYTSWQIGLQKAAAQNLSRQLSETASNLLTPIGFAQMAVDVLAKANVNVEVKVHNWSKAMHMEGFLSAAKGSCEPPVFLEASYYGCDHDTAPIILIGKGVTFDSGGLCLKNRQEMKYSRSNMSGAGTVVAVCRAASALQLPINVRALIPLFENMPGSCAYKPGDVIRSRNGKTIIVNDTDFDGRISLTDAITYSSTYNPKFIVDVGMLCRETGEIMGQGATVVFTNNDLLYEQMRIAGVHTGDRIWRLPLWEYYHLMISDHEIADTGDLYRACGATGSCAAFLHEFVPSVDWIHLDTFGVNRTDGKTWSYLRKGMTGRPTRTIVEFLASLACQEDENEKMKAASCA
ncbi:cytosol aminopeptidase-like [Cimex lectularius]|uniref:Cytosol aminopeptidase n=1 Tax=Cimex lectularius TaxID=79782 RepID=A0A8I6RCD3_CIMLE|nr:cytosol aminopeptidase-like [Cimex lectularius]